MTVVLVNLLYDNVWMSKIYEEILQLNDKRRNNLIQRE
jgi:hypothetical protein